jgi:sugar (pentulose or hexulose) kinase
VERLTEFFKVDKNDYKKVEIDDVLLEQLKEKNKGERVFFAGTMPEDFIDKDADLGKFDSFHEAYHQLMIDLTILTSDSINLIITPEDKIKNLFVTGGFAKNPLFTKLLAARFCDKSVYTSEVDNATSLGAALVLWKCFGDVKEPELDLGLQCIPGPRNGKVVM